MWTSEREEAFLKLKEYLASTPVLCKPLSSTPLRLYFAMTDRAISSVLVQEQDQVQKPIYFVIEESNEGRRVNLDLVDDVREQARVKVEALTKRVERKQRPKLRPRQFQAVDLVMRRAHPYQLENKLSPKWTGPFCVVEALGNGTYRLETLEGGAIP